MIIDKGDRMKNSDNSVTEYLSNLEKKLSSDGLPLHEYQVLQAVRLPEFQKALNSYIKDNFVVDEIIRVYYTQNSALLEVLARLSRGQGILKEKKCVLVTFKAANFSFVSIATDFDEPEYLRPEGVTFVPFPMALPTVAEQTSVSADNPSFIIGQQRRSEFLRRLVGEDGLLKDTTKTTTDSGTCSSSTVETTYECWVATTNNGRDNDAIQDSKFDTSQDCPTDVNDDARNDVSDLSFPSC